MPKMAISPKSNQELIFKVKPRLLTLLGDQLIRSANLAVFELVKNSYDADATHCLVELENIDEQSKASIIIQDNGTGMDEDIFRNVWMEIATDFRNIQRTNNFRTSDFKRLPLGEKGLGRLSIHKLGRSIRLITRVKGGIEMVMEFDWDKIENASELNNAHVTLERRDPITFPSNKHGTRLEVNRLREPWARGQVRQLYRAVNSLCSPVQGPTDFVVILSAPGHEDWLKGMFTYKKAHKSALYHVSGSFQGGSGEFNYFFTPPPGTENQLTRRKVHQSLLLRRGKGRNSEPLDLSVHKIGKVEFEFWLFDRHPAVLRAVSDDIDGLKLYLDENGGIRIYRDGIRVYDFGEPGNDWLNLDIRRVNTPVARTSNNQILGILRLDATQSGDLREKTNREGFIENQAYSDLINATLSVLTQVEAEKTKDQIRVRRVVGKGTGQKLFLRLAELRTVLESNGMLAEVESKLTAVEKEMELYREQLLHAAVPGLTLGIMLHGVEKILEELREAAKDEEITRIKDLVDRLYRAMRPVTNLLKNPSVAKTSASILIKEAIFSTELRLKRHDITLVNGMNTGCRDFIVNGSKQMLVASITNLIDNSIHWLEIRNPQKKLLYLGTTNELEGGLALVVADNGPGFGNDSPDDLVEPFFTRRSGSMGLGLYIVNEVMQVNKGKLLFPSIDEITLPDDFTGAIVALQFPEAK